MLFLTLSALAAAHMALEEPLPRYPTDGNGANKACPCGVGDSNRLCDNPNDRSDPDRSVYVTTYAPGETITMRWHETIGHAGRWRIAFDKVGADMADFNQTILADIPDPAGTAGNTGNGNLWQVTVTLPNTRCDNCTLQLVQMMDGNTSTPVADPIGRSSYYQCADIILEGDPVDTDLPLDTSQPDTDVAVDTSQPDTDTPADTAAPTKQSEAACGCASTQSLPQALALLLSLAALRRRKRP